MTETRSSAHKSSSDAAAGTKRKPEVQPSPKRETKAAKKQTTIEDTMELNKETDEDMKEGSDDGGPVKEADESEEKVEQGKQENESGSTTKDSTANEQGAVQESSQREKEVPSNILEKGVIYFFTRNRVGIEESESVGDLQRTFFVLRPMPVGAKLGDGPLADNDNNRLFALPKKVFPKSHSDRFMAFVEKANVTIKELKESFFSGEEYNTKTQGTRRIEPVAPVAEGVYAITRTEDRTSHLVYSTTIPSELGEVQDDLGIRDQGSFIISVKNPERSGPAQAQLPQKPDFPKE